MAALNETIARMRRALAGDDDQMDRFVELLANGLLLGLPDEEALRLERMFAQIAQAGEELGPDADKDAIMARYREIAARPN